MQEKKVVKIEDIEIAFSHFLTLGELLTVVDRNIMKDLVSQNDGSEEVYEFLRSDVKPLNPREFLEMWGSLTWEEQFDYWVSVKKITEEKT